MAKDKKKKKGKKADSSAKSVKRTLKELSENRLVSEVVAAALVGAASALKDPKKARQLAEQAGDELKAAAAEGAERGNAMWQLALEVGRRAIYTLAGEGKGKAAKPPKKSAKKSTGKTKAPAPKPKAPAAKSKAPAAKSKAPAAKSKAPAAKSKAN